MPSAGRWARPARAHFPGQPLSWNDAAPPRAHSRRSRRSRTGSTRACRFHRAERRPPRPFRPRGHQPEGGGIFPPGRIVPTRCAGTRSPQLRRSLFQMLLPRLRLGLSGYAPRYTGVASSISMIGMPSRTGYLSLSRWHVNASSAPLYSSGPLHLGQTRISRSCGASGMLASVVCGIAKAAECRCVLSPILQYFDPKFEVHVCADESFNLLASSRAKQLDGLPLLADEYSLLTVALDVDHRPNVDGRAVLAKILDLTRNTVWNFRAKLLECRLSDELGGKKPNRVDAHVLDRQQERTFGKMGLDRGDERRESLACECGDEDSLRQCQGERLSVSAIEQVGLVEGYDGWCPRWRIESRYFVQWTRHALARVTHVDDAIGVSEGRDGGGLHGRLEQITGIEQAWGVGQDHLGIAFGADTDNAIAGGLRLVARDAELLADQAIEEGGFAGVWLSGDGDGSVSGHGGSGKYKRPSSDGRPFEKGAGDGLLSRDLSIGVPSALQGLTLVFGTGTGVAPAL